MLDMTLEKSAHLSNNMYMLKASVVDLKSNLKFYLEKALQGVVVTVVRRNMPIAEIVPVESQGPNLTVLGSGKGSVTFLGDLTSPLIPESDWEMLN